MYVRLSLINCLDKFVQLMSRAWQINGVRESHFYTRPSQTYVRNITVKIFVVCRNDAYRTHRLSGLLQKRTTFTLIDLHIRTIKPPKTKQLSKIKRPTDDLYFLHTRINNDHISWQMSTQIPQPSSTFNL